MGKFKLQLLGEFRLEYEATGCLDIRSKKARALLAYLAIRPTFGASRLDLARALWERHDDPQALTNLRQTLSVLNQRLHPQCPDWLIKRSGFVALNPVCFDIDVRRVELDPSAASEADLVGAVDQFRGSFLQGISFTETALNDWIEQTRRSCDSTHINLRKSLLQSQARSKNYTDATINAEILLQQDPVDESLHCQLMSFYSLMGQRHRVMRQFQKCSDALEQHQLGQPMESTVSLFQRLYHDTVVQPVFCAGQIADVVASVEAPPSNSIPAIAVLPFKDMDENSMAYSLGFALTEETVNELRRFNGFKVISALSSVSIGGQSLDIPTMAKMLGARYLVSGSITHSQHKIRLAVELVDTICGELIWAKSYLREIEDLFVLQAELAASIAGNIEPEAVGHACFLSAKKTPASLSAWDLVLRGDHQLFKQLGTRRNSDVAAIQEGLEEVGLKK